MKMLNKSICLLVDRTLNNNQLLQSVNVNIEMTKFQIYSHYKLPITMDPLKFGKLLDQTNNKFIIQLTTKNVAVINHYEKENFIKIYRNGDWVLEFRDTFIADNSFKRFIRDTKFTFVNERLAKTEIFNRE